MTGRDALPLALICLLLTSVFADMLFLASSPVDRDVVTYHFPMRKAVRDLVQTGSFPYWNPLLEAGQPLAANPAYGLFYPPNWLTHLPRFALGFKLHILVHIYLAAIGMYLLLRALTLSPTAAAFGAICFALGGPLMSYAAFPAFLFSSSWIPWLLFFALRFDQHGRPAAFALAALVVAMQCLAGEPVTIVMSASLFAAGAALRRGLRGVAVALLIVVSGALLAAVQLLPAIDHVRDSVRSLPMAFDRVAQWSLAPTRPLELLYPDVAFGTLPFITTIYAGVLPALLALGGIVTRQRGWRWVAAISAVSYVIALGKHTPLFSWLYDLRLASSLRYPEKWIFAATVVLIIFAAFVLDRLLAGDRSLARTCAWLAGAALIGALVLSGIAGSLRCGLAVALFAISAQGAVRRFLPALILVFATVDVVSVTNGIMKRQPDRYFDRPPILGKATIPPGYRLFHEAEVYEPPRPAFMDDWMARPWVYRNNLRPYQPMAWGIPTVMNYDFDETNLLSTRRLRVIAQIAREGKHASWPLTYMALANAPYRSVALDPVAALRQASGDLETMTTIDIRRESMRAERYRFAESIVPCDSVERCAEVLKNTPPDTALALVFTPPPFRPAPGTVEGVAERMNEVTLNVASQGTGFLIASITNHKYWQATIDERLVPIIDANVAFQGVVVPPGRHRVRFVYRNPLIAIGAAISLVTAAVLGGGTLRGFFASPSALHRDAPDSSTAP